VKSVLVARFQLCQDAIGEYAQLYDSVQRNKINVKNMPVKFALRKIKNQEISYLILVNVQAHAELCILTVFFNGLASKSRKKLLEGHCTITLKNSSVKFVRLNSQLLLRLTMDKLLRCFLLRSQKITM
jgi:hypothetical protein